MTGQKSERPSRREFLESAGQGVAASALAGVAIPAVHAGESHTIKIALVGCGGRGTGAAANALSTRSGPIKLVAMADIFDYRLRSSYDTLTNTGGNAAAVDRPAGTWDISQVDVPPERRFLGFDAYKQAMECLSAGDIVLLTTPCAFRSVHFAHAIDRGIHVFMEKPTTVDGPSTRRMLALADRSAARNLKVGVGLMCRHCEARKALLQRIRDGQIGDITLMKTYRLVGPAGFTGPKPPDMSELLYQVKNYLSFYWASGGLVHDYTSHNIDECCWMKGSWPVRAHGLAGRYYRGDEVDQNLDHYSVEYTFADGTNLYLNARNMTGCHGEFASYAHGTKGSAVISTAMHTPAKCRIYKGHNFAKGDLTWAFPQPEPNPYQLEWDHLVAAIREDKPYNEARRGAEASLVQIMGRMACHTGQVVTWDQALNASQEFAPGLDRLTMASEAPVHPGKDGRYPTPQPGILADREY
ncbi:Inositol 2-dehydrogenase/D-chiro-inositol 3-dehydrogenase [Aquisphaera giovannonii]|uniref:Inositol 2-dehydrogenase/D-chiro-inositol 3-dehydrogenase n=1 Tax=Aquisphaera giovannonii TaxID=406548 RepID=A0A5B9VXP6_9BACT|nr:Gfo/Idh/MocA family oxidoreductase [Aquisphaera giovannonii]QEH33052.1 Inositol 2-dehydrogenase/D-chiro-inositol 3-dehydrogenase [Aquisphaera giovannonii]